MTGSVVLATTQGLGLLAKDFYDHGIIDKVLVHKHSKRENHYEWYPDRVGSLEELIETCDTFLFFETPFYWDAMARLKALGKKIILMPMYECTLHPFPVEIDVLLCTSDLDFNLYTRRFKEKIRINVPVPDIIRENWKLRKKANYFVHNAGNGGLAGRNGTKELIEAMEHVKLGLQLRIRSQVPLPVTKRHDSRIVYEIGETKYEKLFSDDDVFIFPEKFNGLSLPLQEAYASGMMVMAGDRFPINNWLPKEPLLPVKYYTKELAYFLFDIAQYNPKVIALKIEEWYGKDIERFSYMGKEWAEQNSWNNLISKYKDICK